MHELSIVEALIDQAEVHIKQPKATCQCGSCGTRSEVDDWFSDCPKCGSAEVTVEGGRELLLQSIEIED
jgi:hydrogenase nickel incorporation protein HypA/HybF